MLYNVNSNTHWIPGTISRNKSNKIPNNIIYINNVTPIKNIKRDLITKKSTKINKFVQLITRQENIDRNPDRNPIGHTTPNDYYNRTVDTVIKHNNTSDIQNINVNYKIMPFGHDKINNIIHESIPLYDKLDVKSNTLNEIHIDEFKTPPNNIINEVNRKDKMHNQITQKQQYQANN